ncbi:hypothetical protein ACR75P_08370 [Faecalicoccus pleomorphus]|uniref:hypothetical protein n=1 Tax=Faecalicoccus pleomorphus TaxID=1323 RepID=UPI003DA275D5
MLTKEECRESLSDLYNVLCSRLNEEMQDYRQDFDRLGELIEEHFSNPPLSLNEVRQFWHEGIPVWDTELEEYVQINDVIGNEENGLVSVEQFFFESISVYQYHSKRFYRKEVQE